MTMREILGTLPANVLDASRQLRLTSLVWSIPLSSKKLAHCVYMLTQYALGVDYINHNVFLKSIRGQNAVAERKAEMKKGELTLTGKQEPFEQFLIRALAMGKTWEQLVQEHRIEKRFINIESLWQHRQYFLMFLCDANYPREEGIYLAFRCIFRTSEAIIGKVLVVRDCHYYKSRLDHWISKQVCEINKLDDRLLSMLIQAVKKEMNLAETLKSLKELLEFQWIDKFCELHWLNFLCSQLQSGKEKEIFKTCQLRRTISWRMFDKCQKGRYNGEVVYRLQKKLLRCLKDYANFEEYFIDELEIILLNSIRNKVPWPIVKEKINALFVDNITQGEECKQNQGEKTEEKTKVNENLKVTQEEQETQDKQKDQKKQLEEKEEEKIQEKSLGLKYEESIITHTSQDLDRVREQNQMISLIGRAKECFKSIEDNNFKDMTSDALAHYVTSHKRQMETLAEEKLAHYRKFPQEVDHIQDEYTKMLMRSLLAFQKKADVNTSQISAVCETQSFINEKDAEQTMESEMFELMKRQSSQILHKMGLSTKIHEPVELTSRKKKKN